MDTARFYVFGQKVMEVHSSQRWIFDTVQHIERTYGLPGLKQLSYELSMAPETHPQIHALRQTNDLVVRIMLALEIAGIRNVWSYC